eukprot:SAG31_NODE_4129_length_3555_cov_25.339988_2_plen_65_part_00
MKIFENILAVLNLVGMPIPTGTSTKFLQLMDPTSEELIGLPGMSYDFKFGTFVNAKLLCCDFLP